MAMRGHGETKSNYFFGQSSENIVNRGELLGNGPTKFFVVGFCSLFWP